MKKDDMSNYRSISLLPQVSNILVKLFAKTILTNSNSQYGFKANTSTSHTLADASNYITSNLDKDHFTMRLFIDPRKTFDTVDHSVLLKTLEYYGIRGMSSDFLKS